MVVAEVVLGCYPDLNLLNLAEAKGCHMHLHPMFVSLKHLRTTDND
jgi:hypothetical protein